MKHFTGRDISGVPVSDVSGYIEEADILRGFQVGVIQEAIVKALDGE